MNDYLYLVPVAVYALGGLGAAWFVYRLATKDDRRPPHPGK